MTMAAMMAAPIPRMAYSIRSAFRHSSCWSSTNASTCVSSRGLAHDLLDDHGGNHWGADAQNGVQEPVNLATQFTQVDNQRIDLRFQSGVSPGLG